MRKQFINLILIPCTFLIVILGTIFFKTGPLPFLLFLAIVFEHLFKWMLSVNSKYSDFRIFYTDQYFKLQYLGILFLIYIINTISWKYTSFWSIFAYAANFIIFRIIGSTGTDQLSQTPGAISKPILSSFDLWEENKNALSNLLQKSNNTDLKNFMKAKLNYSSFLRTNKAANLIKQTMKASDEEFEKLMLKIKDLL
tara:strand:+ start:663 stop:1253 length:591 start_codon:yes stop_codon:yes gene_type:complete